MIRPVASALIADILAMYKEQVKTTQDNTRLGGVDSYSNSNSSRLDRLGLGLHYKGYIRHDTLLKLNMYNITLKTLN